MSMAQNESDDLTQRIADAMVEWKTSKAEAGSPFIRPWRIYTLENKEAKEPISCSAGECGCGISPDMN